MARTRLEERLGILDLHLGHWSAADALGMPIEILAEYGRPQFLIQRDAYAALEVAIAKLESDLEVLRSERDGIWGVSPEDDLGLWFRLKQYKTVVALRLGARHPLTRTVPNLGRIGAHSYVEIAQRFIDHWERVNLALPAPLTLGAFTIALLQTGTTNLLAKIAAINTTDATLSVHREEREQLFGDEAEELREATSLVSRMLLYHVIIETTFPNQPIATSLPNVFPPESSGTLPTFDFNYVTQAGGVLKTWFAVASAPAGTATVFLKEGAVELSFPLQASPAGGMQINLWNGVTLVGELDELELRNASGLTVARGVRDSSLPEPI